MKEELLKLLSQQPQGEAKRVGLGLRSLLTSDKGLGLPQSVQELDPRRAEKMTEPRAPVRCPQGLA